MNKKKVMRNEEKQWMGISKRGMKGKKKEWIKLKEEGKKEWGEKWKWWEVNGMRGRKDS